MSQKNVKRALRGGARALTGVVIIAVAAVAAVIVGAAPLPAIERQPVSLTVDTLQGAERQFVCPGSFAVLGADPSRPGVAVPMGVASLTLAGQASGQTELVREEAGGSSPVALAVPAAEAFAAAQTQAVQTDALRGLTAASCAEPVNEQWLLGGSTTVGVSTTLNLGNPSGVPATVHLTVYDENGQVDSSLTSGVLVPAGSERVVSLNGYAPGRERIAVRVDSTGAAVTASLGIGEVAGLDSFAVDTVTRQLAGETTLVVPGVANLNDHEEGPGDTGGIDAYPVIVRALSTTGQSGTASVRALFADGTDELLGAVELVGSAVGELSISHWPEKAEAVVVESTVPVIGGVLGSANRGPQHDYAWFAPAPELAADARVLTAVVPRGQLVLANPGSVDAEVRIAGLGSSADQGADDADADDDFEKTVTVPAGGAIALSVPVSVSLESTAAVHAAVRRAAGGDIAGYPVLGEPDQVSSLTVYTR
jgi:hypothetical protein